MPAISAKPARHELQAEPGRQTGASQTPRFTIRDIFFGTDGLRAGWGILLFLRSSPRLSSTAIYPLGSGAESGSAVGSGRAVSTPSLMVFHEGAALFCVLVATWLMARIERRPVTAYGFRPQHRCATSSPASPGVWLCSRCSSSCCAPPACWSSTRACSSAAASFATEPSGSLDSCWSACSRSLFSRGYLQFTLTRGLGGIYRWLFGAGTRERIGFWSAALILSFFFGFGHRTNPGESPLGLLSAGARWPPLLLQPVAHRLALVGHRLPYFVGLGAVVPLRRRGQRLDGPAAICSPPIPSETHSSPAVLPARRAASCCCPVMLAGVARDPPHAAPHLLRLPAGKRASSPPLH